MLDTKILALTLSALIVGVESQASCDSKSPQCCWVVRSWQLMGKTIPAGISSTDNSCCTKPMTGVYCGDSTKTKVTSIVWYSRGLSGSIPAEIGNLKYLQNLYLYNNKLSGSIPSTIGNLTSLTRLWLYQNPSLNGAFTPKCGINVAAGNTSVTLCGCAAAGSPAFSFPPENTTAACLASSTAGGTLRKRAQVFSYMVDGNQYTCNNNTEGNPSQDCMNSLVFYCKSERLNAGSSFECKNRVDEMTRGLNGHWQTWRYRCSNPTWTFSSSRILTGITNCDSAIQNLKEKAKYSVEGAVIAVPDALIDSAKTLLWDRLN